MSASDLAPYATARTSILVHKGKGILVKRAQSRDEAIVDAINEFGLRAAPHQVYLTSYVGAQGQEVEISRSAFAYIRDTIPIHVHLREEDDSSERARWPALPLAGFASDPPKPEPPPQATLPLRLPYLFGLGRGEGSKTSESKLESVSDWQRQSAGTPDTSASVHRPQTKVVEMKGGESVPAGSPEEMLSDTAMNSLINGYAANGTSLPQSLTESQPNSLPSNNAGKAWNWFKKAGSALTVPTANNMAVTTTNSEKCEPVKTEAGKPHANLELPRRPSKDDKQYHRHSLKKLENRPAAERDMVTHEIETLLQDKRTPISEVTEPIVGLSVHKHRTSATYESVEEDEQWGPGGLVVEGASDADVSTTSQAVPKAQPWWAQPAGLLDAKASKKLGLKPLALNHPDNVNLDSTSSGVHESSQTQDASSQQIAKRASRSIGRPRHAPKDSGRVSPGAPIAGRRRRKNSQKFSRDDGDARPTPPDMPESPFSARRFTRHDVNMELTAAYHRPSRSRMLPRDAVDDVVSEPETDRFGRLNHPTRQKNQVPPPCSPSDTQKYSGQAERRDIKTRPVVAQPTSEKKEVSVPVVPVAARPPQRPLLAERSDSKGGGALAAAASAARRQMTTRDPHSIFHARGGTPVATDPRTGGRDTVKRTSLSSLRDFVAAEIPDESTNRKSRESHEEDVEKEEEEEEEASAVKLERLVLGPMDLSSPNRKGSELVMKAKLETCQLSLEWQPERRVVVSVPFDSIRALQLPEPGSSESFLVIRPMNGDVRVILVEMTAENLLAFQRYMLVFIAGLGADVEHLSAAEYSRAAKANGW